MTGNRIGSAATGAHCLKDLLKACLAGRVKESRRLMEILNTHLKGRQYLVADEYTVADIATYPWARAYYWAKLSVDGLPHLNAWFDRIDAREATQRALEIPEPFWAFFGKGDIEELERENAERFKDDV